MLKKHGSEEAVREAMRSRQKKSRENYSGDGGFRYLKKNDPAQLKKISSEGGKSAKSEEA